jgi:hypothetical protein
MSTLVGCPAICGISGFSSAGRLNLTALPIPWKVLRAAIDRAVRLDHFGAADTDQRREFQASFLGPPQR